MQKKIIFRLRCAICVLLATISFAFPVGTSYLGGLTAAYGFAPAVAPVLELLQMILASAGVTFQTTQDLTTFGNAYGAYWENSSNIQDFADASGMTVEEYKQFMQEINDKSCIDFGTDIAKKVLVSVRDFYARFYGKDAINKNTAVADSTGVHFGTAGLAKQMLSYFSERGMKGKTNAEVVEFCASREEDAASCRAFFIRRKFDATVSTEQLDIDYFPFDKTNMYLQRCVNDSGVSCVTFCKCSDGSVYSGTFSGSRYRSSTLDSPFDYYNSMAFYNGKFSLLDWTLYTRMPIYNSYEDYLTSSSIAVNYPLSKPSVNTDKSFTLPDSKTLTGDLSFTENIENALNDANVATSEDINAAVGDLIDSYAQEIGKVQDSIDSQTGILAGWLSKIYDKLTQIEADTGTGVTVDLGDLENAYAPEQTNPDSDNDDKKPYIWVPGSIAVASFLKPVVEFFSEPLSDITRWLDKIATSITALPSKCAAAIGEYIPSLDEIEAGISSIQDSLSGTLTVAIDGITDLPGEIGDAVASAIPGQITAHLEGITDLPKDIADAVAGAIVIPGSIALEGIETLPKDIADAIASALSGALDIPDHIALDIPETIPIAFPDTLTVDTILDLPEVLEGTLSGVFAIDDAAVSTAVDALAAEWTSKFPYHQLAAVFAPLSFSDQYSYPVLKIQRPDILKNFNIPPERLTSEDGKVYIILCNTADYAQYFKYIRNIVRAMIWVAFAYHLLRGFKVYFHIA